MTDRIRAVAAVALVAAVSTAPAAHATADQLCDQLGGVWDGLTCSAAVQSPRRATMQMSIQLPRAALDNPLTAPPLTDYYRSLFDGWRATGVQSPRDSSASADVTTYSGPGAVQNIVVHETFAPSGVQPNNAYRSFVFDMSTGRRLGLTDLFLPGVDPLRAISDAARPIVQNALDTAQPPHLVNTYPFTAGHWQPSAEGQGFNGDYRAFGLAADGLILYLPDQPMQRENPTPEGQFVWSIDGGTITVKIPLPLLSQVLRPRYGGRS